MADRRRIAVWLMTLGVAIVVASASMGAAFPFSLFLVAIALTTAFHWMYACRHCSNPDCAINPRGACFFLARRTRDGEAACAVGRRTALDAKIAGAPLLAALTFGMVLSWIAVPEATVPSLAFLGVGFALYSNATCISCTNDCPLNRAEARAGDEIGSEDGPRPVRARSAQVKATARH